MRACRRCRPDDFYAGAPVNEARIDALLATDVGDLCGVPDLARRAGIGVRRLGDLFREQLQTTPADWLTRRRVEGAQALLLEGDRPAAEVAFEVGFESLSAFGEQFRRLSALTPQAFRRCPQGQPFTLALPDDYPLSAMLRDLNRDSHGTTAWVEGHTLHAGLRLPGGPLAVSVAFQDGAARVTPHGPSSLPTEPRNVLALHGALLRLLGLHGDPARFEAAVSAQPILAPLLEGRRGLRLPLSASLFDGLVWAVAGQQVSFAFACTLRRRLIERTGAPVHLGLYAPPSADGVAALDLPGLLALGFTRARANLLGRLARSVAGGELDLEALARGPVPRAERTLLGIPGIGPWTANYMLLRAFGAADAVPLGDSALTSALQAFYGLNARPNRRQTDERMAAFSPHRSLATFHFWNDLRERREPS